MSDNPKEIIQARKQLLGDMINRAETKLGKLNSIEKLTPNDIVCIWIAISNSYIPELISHTGSRALQVLSVEVIDNQLEVNKLDDSAAAHGILKKHLRLEP